MQRPDPRLIALASLIISSSAMANTFITYSNRTYLPVSFEYPSDWLAEPSSGSTEQYTQIQVYAPQAPEDKLRTYLVVRMVPPKSQGGRFADLEEMIGSYRSTLTSQKSQIKIDGQRQLDVLGGPATMLEISGGLLLPWKSKNPALVPVKGQRVFLERAGQFYELAWMSPVDRAPDIEAIFSRLLTSLAPLPD